MLAPFVLLAEIASPDVGPGLPALGNREPADYDIR